MKASIVPATCSVALAVMSAAVLSHWCSVRSFVRAVESKTLALTSAPELPPSRPAPAAPAPVASVATVTAPAPAPSPTRPTPAAAPARARDSQQEFFVSLLDEFKQLKREMTAIKSQTAETNRDLMNLEFRVDTHSTQFRPLRVEEPLENLENLENLEELTLPPVMDDGPGVLPPRPEIVGLPGLE